MKPSKEPEQPTPDVTWYQKHSAKLRLPLRCRFASARLCPRYFHTLWLFGRYAVAERMSDEEIGKIEERLEKSPLFSKEFQPQPEVTPRRDTMGLRNWSDCCPEVVFDAYGAFAGAGSLMDKHDMRLRHAELKNVAVHPEDLRWKFGYLTPAHYSECREFAILASVGKESSGRRTKGSDPAAVSPRRRWEVLARDSYTCQYCGRKPPEVVLHVDHIDPNGGNSVENLITACQECNLGKSNRVARRSVNDELPKS